MKKKETVKLTDESEELNKINNQELKKMRQIKVKIN